jgi:hypothetical protein
MKMVVGGEGFVGGENEVAGVKGGGGFLDPEVSIGNLAVAPTGDGRAVGVAIKNVAEQKGAGGGFAVTFALLESGLSRVEAAAPGEAASTEIDGDGGILGDPRSGGRVAPIELEIGVAGVPTFRDGEKKGTRRVRNGGGKERGREKRKKKKEQTGHTA